MAILVTGGAGYIGSHCVAALCARGADVVVVDNLSTGHREALKGGRLYVGDVGDRTFLEGVFRQEQIEAVIHFAAFSLVAESMAVPEKYFRNNCMAGLTLIDTMLTFGVPYLIFSSTAATYGEPDYVPIDEEHPKKPTNAYGESKLIVERMLRWNDSAHGLKYVALRYFNVAGALSDGSIGEDHSPETHLIPLVLATALGQREKLSLFGTDYPTRDAARAAVLAACDVEATSSLGANLELNAPGVNKGRALVALAETLGYRRENVMACGDSDNDLAMIRMAGLGVAMGNAEPEILAAAAAVTDDNDHDGVAKAIERYILGTLVEEPPVPSPAR